MKNLLSLTVAIVTLSSCLTNIEAQGIKCDGQEMKPATDNTMVTKMKACLDKHVPEAKKLNSKASQAEQAKAMEAVLMAAAKNICFQVCLLQADKIFDGKGAYSPTAAGGYATKSFPTKKLAGQITEGLNKCAKGQKFSMQNKCASYKKFIGCMNDNITKVCKLKG